jgi:hypothetical protein
MKMSPVTLFMSTNLFLTIILGPALVCSTDTNRISYHSKPELIVHEIE